MFIPWDPQSSQTISREALPAASHGAVWLASQWHKLGGGGVSRTRCLPVAVHSRTWFSWVEHRAGFPLPPGEPVGCSPPCACWGLGGHSKLPRELLVGLGSGVGTRHSGPRVQQLQPTLVCGALADVFGAGGGSLFGGREVVFVFYHSSHLF